MQKARVQAELDAKETAVLQSMAASKRTKECSTSVPESPFALSQVSEITGVDEDDCIVLGSKLFKDGCISLQDTPMTNPPKKKQKMFQSSIIHRYYRPKLITGGA